MSLGQPRGTDRLGRSCQLSEEGALSRAKPVSGKFYSWSQPDLALELLTCLRGTDLPVRFNAAVGTQGNDTLDPLEHARRKHAADDQRGWRKVVRRDVARERYLEWRE